MGLGGGQRRRGEEWDFPAAESPTDGPAVGSSHLGAICVTSWASLSTGVCIGVQKYDMFMGMGGKKGAPKPHRSTNPSALPSADAYNMAKLLCDKYYMASPDLEIEEVNGEGLGGGGGVPIGDWGGGVGGDSQVCHMGLGRMARLLCALQPAMPSSPSASSTSPHTSTICCSSSSR